MAVNVRCACLTLGSRNALTPLLTASTPVIAVQPLAKARSNNHHLAPSLVGDSGGGAMIGVGCPLDMIALANPKSSSPPTLAMKR